jgi:hypothetical protein
MRYSITVNQNKAVVRAMEAIPDQEWTPIDYTPGGQAGVAECTYGDDHRLVVRRTRLTGKQAELFPSWRFHAFITDRDGTAVFLDADHRRHTVVELAIRDLKEGAGMTHCPSGDFNANVAWVVLAAIAHNMVRWLVALGLDHPGPVVTKTISRKFITVPATSHADHGEHSFTCRRSIHGPPSGQRASTPRGSASSNLNVSASERPTRVQPLPSRSPRLSFWSVTPRSPMTSRIAPVGASHRTENNTLPVHVRCFGGWTLWPRSFVMLDNRHLRRAGQPHPVVAADRHWSTRPPMNKKSGVKRRTSDTRASGDQRT